MDLADVKAALLVESAHLAGVIERAGDGDELVVEAARPQLGQPLDRCVDDRDVAFAGERDAARDPVLLAQLHQLVERVPVLLAAPGEVDLGRRDVGRGDLLDVSALHRVAERIAVDELALDRLLVCPERRRRQAEHPRRRRSGRRRCASSARRCDGPSSTMIRSKKSGRQVRQPALRPLAELVDVRDDDVRVLAVAQVRIAVEHGPVGAVFEVRRTPVRR